MKLQTVSWQTRNGSYDKKGRQISFPFITELDWGDFKDQGGSRQKTWFPSKCSRKHGGVSHSWKYGRGLALDGLKDILNIQHFISDPRPGGDEILSSENVPKLLMLLCIDHTSEHWRLRQTHGRTHQPRQLHHTFKLPKMKASVLSVCDCLGRRPQHSSEFPKNRCTG